jgi:hypothetical protein
MLEAVLGKERMENKQIRKIFGRILIFVCKHQINLQFFAIRICFDSHQRYFGDAEIFHYSLGIHLAIVFAASLRFFDSQ